MKHSRIYLLMFPFLMLCATATEVRAVTWGNAPLACLPNRAVPWTNNTQAELCHCPPKSMCPQSSSTVTPADVTFNVNIALQDRNGNSAPITPFTISGKDVANYYSTQPANAPYAPFDPSQIFAMKDNPRYACPQGVIMDKNGTHSTTQGWGAIQDYIAPLVQQYLNNQGVNYCQDSANGSCRHTDSFCDLGGGIMQYSVTITVTPQIANAINNQAMLMPDTILSQCCPATFTCPTGSVVRTGFGGSVSCVVTVDETRVGCVLEGTPIALANGKTKKVEQIALGERLKGDHGEVTVIALNKFTQNTDEMYGFNGGKAFITSEHPILSTDGWKAINPSLTTVKSGIGHIGKLKIGDEVVTAAGKLKIASIEEHTIKAPAIAYNLAVKGGNGFIANDIIVKGFSQVEIHY